MAFAEGTTANHQVHLKLFLSFAIYFNLTAFPASTATLLLFLEFLTLSYNSIKAVTNVFSSIRFHHEKMGLTLAAFQHIQLRLALRSLRFTMRTHVAPAPPFPPLLLKPLVGAARVLGEWELPFSALVVFAFLTFARLSSLVPVSPVAFDASRWPSLADLGWEGGAVTLRIKYSKTRQAADGGFRVPMHESSTLPCPLGLARALLARAKRLRFPSHAPLFAARPERGGRTLLSLTQGQARRFLRQCLQVLGLPPTAFSFHSFRRGGCSLAFAQGASEADLARHGDWRSAAVREYYPASLSRDRVARTLTDALPTRPH